ncbi:MAG: ral nucleoside transport system permease protein [Acidobacteriota bacterium]|jgi:simple sugar transport system permease protein|nr:ral nucleoside transport system permease protein [Acidobacteriota bacterium]
MRNIFTIALIYSTVRLATPLLLAALGGLYSERSGVINIALEGLMLAGAFTAATVTHLAGVKGYPFPQWIGLLAAIAAGVIVAGIHAVACIKFKADQVVTGTAINILFLGVPALMSGALFDSTGATPQIPINNLLPNAPIVIAFALVPITWYVLYRTPFGLRLRAVGENPEAADTAGVSVARIRYTGVLLSGALAAIGGAYLSIGESSLFTRNMTAGRGFIALAALIFGKWRPVQTMLACLLFGFAEAVAIQMQGVAVPSLFLLGLLCMALFLIIWFLIRLLPLRKTPLLLQIAVAVLLTGGIGLIIYLIKFRHITENNQIPVQFIQIIPYVLTIVVLAGFIGHSRAPRALGIPYQKEK